MKRLVTLSLTLALIISLAAPSGAVFAHPEVVEQGEPVPMEGMTHDVDAIVDDTEDGEGEKQDLIDEMPQAVPQRQDVGLVAVEPQPPVRIPEVVIAQIQVGVSGDVNDEYVSIYNNSNEIVDVTGWCLQSANGVRFVCLPDDTDYEMAPRSYISFSTKPRLNDAEIRVTIQPCGGRSGCIVGVSDTVRLLMEDDMVVNEITWSGNASSRYAIERKWDEQAPGRLMSGKDSDSWEAKVRLAHYGYIEELMECADGGLVASGDHCPVPPEVCRNLPDLQIDMLPPEFEVDDEGNCYENVCTNLPGFHEVPPVGFMASEDGTCALNLSLPLEVTELLPNPKGVDDGNEFIELYNPNDTDVDLAWWVFHLNGDYDRVYSFPAGMTIGAGEYAVVKNSDVAFSLRNSSGSVRLRSIDNQHVVDVPEWLNAKDDRSWALIDGAWQYADPSPGEENPVPVLLATGGMGGLADCGEGRERNPLTGRCRNIPTAKELAPCKDGQYRSEETNRCRNIALAGSTLKPCREGQYRSEETNRCRSIANAAARVLKPCADDQFRNPETNRCKKIASAEELADCGEGRERNPATNRCRNVTTAASMPTVGFAPEAITQTASGMAGWWVAGGVSSVALGYAVWQWRFEISRLIKKAGTLVPTRSK